MPHPHDTCPSCSELQDIIDQKEARIAELETELAREKKDCTATCNFVRATSDRYRGSLEKLEAAFPPSSWAAQTAHAALNPINYQEPYGPVTENRNPPDDRHARRRE